jgi:hypothetical protein
VRQRTDGLVAGLADVQRQVAGLDAKFAKFDTMQEELADVATCVRSILQAVKPNSLGAVQPPGKVSPAGGRSELEAALEQMAQEDLYTPTKPKKTFWGSLTKW